MNRKQGDQKLPDFFSSLRREEEQECFSKQYIEPTAKVGGPVSRRQSELRKGNSLRRAERLYYVPVAAHYLWRQGSAGPGKKHLLEIEVNLFKQECKSNREES